MLLRANTTRGLSAKDVCLATLAWIVLRGNEVPCLRSAAWDDSWNGGESAASDFSGCFEAREAQRLEPGGVDADALWTQ